MPQADLEGFFAHLEDRERQEDRIEQIMIAAVEPLRELGTIRSGDMRGITIQFVLKTDLKEEVLRKKVQQLFPKAHIVEQEGKDKKGRYYINITLERPTDPNQFESDVANLLEEIDREQAQKLRDTRIIEHVRNAVASLGLGVNTCLRFTSHSDPYNVYVSVSTDIYPDRAYKLYEDLEDLQLQDEADDGEAITQKREEIAEVHKGILERLQALLGEGVKCEEGNRGYDIKVPLIRP